MVMSPSIGDDREPEAVVPPFLLLAHARVGLRIHEARMRIERLQHAVDGAVDQAIGLDRFGVVGLNGAQRRGKRPVVIGKAIFGRQCARVRRRRRPGPTAEWREWRRSADLILAHDRMLTD